MINIKMADEDYDLMSVSDIELFLALKPEIVRIIESLKTFEDIDATDVKLDERNSKRKKAFGLDKNLYPHICLSIIVKSYLGYKEFDLFVDTFNIRIAQHKYDPKMIEDENLTAKFIKFMTEKFPNSNYQNARNEYFKRAQTNKRIEEKLLFFRR